MPGRNRTAYSPLSPSVSVGRVDEGVDFHQATPYKAIGDGTIYRIDPNFYKGTPAVYEKLDKPITVRRSDGSQVSYDEVYYSETNALVSERARVRAGQPIIAGGNAEIGFAHGGLPAASPHYDEGDVTQEGQDFLTFLHDGALPPTAQPDVPASQTAPPGTIRARPTSSGVTGFVGQAGDALEGAASTVWKAGVNAVEGPMKIVLAALWLLKPTNWLRMVEFLTGMFLIVSGLVGLAVALLAKSDLGRAAAGGAAIVPGPVGAIGKAVTVAGSKSGRRKAARSAGENATRGQRDFNRYAETAPTSRKVKNMKRRMVTYTLDADKKPERRTSTRDNSDAVVLPF